MGKDGTRTWVTHYLAPFDNSEDVRIFRTQDYSDYVAALSHDTGLVLDASVVEPSHTFVRGLTERHKSIIRDDYREDNVLWSGFQHSYFIPDVEHVYIASSSVNVQHLWDFLLDEFLPIVCLIHTKTAHASALTNLHLHVYTNVHQSAWESWYDDYIQTQTHLHVSLTLYPYHSIERTVTRFTYVPSWKLHPPGDISQRLHKTVAHLRRVMLNTANTHDLDKARAPEIILHASGTASSSHHLHFTSLEQYCTNITAAVTPVLKTALNTRPCEYHRLQTVLQLYTNVKVVATYCEDPLQWMMGSALFGKRGVLLLYNDALSARFTQKLRSVAEWLKGQTVSFSSTTSTVGQEMKTRIQRAFDSPPVHDHRPTARIIVRGEVNRVAGGQGTRVTRKSKAHAKQRTLHPAQVSAFQSLLHNFVRHAQHHYRVQCVQFHLTFEQCFLQHVNKMIKQFSDMLPNVTLHTYFSHHTTGTQSLNVAKAFRTRPQPPTAATFIVRGDCLFAKPFRFGALHQSTERMYVISRAFNYSPSRPYVVDLFWYVPRKFNDVFYKALLTNHQKTLTTPKQGLHLLYQWLEHDFGISKKHLGFMFEKGYNRAIVNDVCEIIMREYAKLTQFEKA